MHLAQGTQFAALAASPPDARAHMWHLQQAASLCSLQFRKGTCIGMALLHSDGIHGAAGCVLRTAEVLLPLEAGGWIDGSSLCCLHFYVPN